MVLARRRREITSDTLVAASAVAIMALVLGGVYAAHLHPPVMLASLGARRTGCGAAWAYVAVEGLRAGLRAALAARRAVRAV
jgi:hypothetical protein